MQDSPKDAARRNADKHFTTPDAGGDHAKQEAALARAAAEANTNRLRALRLEKEEADKKAADSSAPQPPKPEAT
jgi:hypothetical protein